MESREAKELNFYYKPHDIRIGRFSTVCSYCNLDGYNNDSDEKHIKSVNKYSACCPTFGISSKSGDKLKNILKLGDIFTNMYPNLKYFSVEGIKLEFENELIFFDKLSKLIEVELDGNEIKNIPFSVQNLKDLKSLIIRNNPISSLSGDKSSIFDSLTNLYTLELDNLSLLFDSANEVELISLPNSLHKLVLSRMALNFVPVNLKSCASSLTHFSFTGIPWINFDDYGGYNNSTLTYENINKEFGKIKEDLNKSNKKIEELNESLREAQEKIDRQSEEIESMSRTASTLTTEKDQAQVDEIDMKLMNIDKKIKETEENVKKDGILYQKVIKLYV